MTSLADSIVEAFEQHGCTGLTVWVDSDGQYQVSFRREDKKSWEIHIDGSVRAALEKGASSFTSFRRALPCPSPSPDDFDDILG